MSSDAQATPQRIFNVRARPGNSRTALRRPNPDTVGLRRKKSRESSVATGGWQAGSWRAGGGMATQNERQREQEVISVKVDAALSQS
jgi:hypothetical protein